MKFLTFFKLVLLTISPDNWKFISIQLIGIYAYNKMCLHTHLYSAAER